MDRLFGVSVRHAGQMILPVSLGTYFSAMNVTSLFSDHSGRPRLQSCS
jgi:hypothetical protein